MELDHIKPSEMCPHYIYTQNKNAQAIIGCVKIVLIRTNKYFFWLPKMSPPEPCLKFTDAVHMLIS